MCRPAFCLSALAVTLTATCAAQVKPNPDPLTQEGYILPPAQVAEAALAPWYKNVSITNLSPDHKYFVNLVGDGMPTLDAMGKEHVNLGGFQVDTTANRARSLTTRNSKGIRIVELVTKKSVDVPLRPDARISDVVWSPDSKMIAFFADFLDRTEVWVADAATGKCRQVTPWPVLATMVTTLRWIDSDSLVAVLVPKNRPARIPRPDIATTPQIKLTDSKVTAIRTYPSLLETPYDEQLLEFYTMGQLAKIDVAKGTVKTIGKPAMIRSVDPAPDVKYFLVTVM